MSGIRWVTLLDGRNIREMTDFLLVSAEASLLLIGNLHLLGATKILFILLFIKITVKNGVLIP